MSINSNNPNIFNLKNETRNAKVDHKFAGSDFAQFVNQAPIPPKRGMVDRLFRGDRPILPKPPTKPKILKVVPHGKQLQIARTGRVIQNIDFTKAELDEYSQVFAYFDIDGSGSISNTEIESAMERLGLENEEGEIEKLVAEVDLDGNGQVDFEEFCLMMHKLTAKKKCNEELVRTCFDVFDIDKNGFISKAEFRSIFIHLQGGLSDEQIEEVFHQTDLDGNGIVDYEEFTQLVKTYLSDDME